MQLSERSKQIRRDTIALSKANGGYHYGGCFSVVEILIALFDHVLTDVDKLVFSKGHACWPLYVLLREKGLNPELEGHPVRDPANGIHCTTGSLGHGFPTAVGMALARKKLKIPGIIYVVMSDGECQEGTTWESLLLARQNELDNLVVIVDWNGIQGSGRTKEILSIECFPDVARATGWAVESVSGHDIDSVRHHLGHEYLKIGGGGPVMVIAQTVKGKGVSYMENDPVWHACWPDADQESTALEELAV